MHNKIDILLFEDNTGDAALLQETINQIDELEITLLVSGSLAQGLKLLATQDIDIILLDLSLPDSKGFDSLFSIKKDYYNKPVIILTGNNDYELAKQAIKEGAQDFLIKGKFDSSLLLRSITYAIERAELEQKIADSEKLYRELSEQSPNAICIHSNKKIVYVNSLAVKLAGAKDKSELIGKPVLSFVHSDSIDTVIERFLLMEKGENVGITEEKFIKNDGTVINVEVSAAPVNYEKQKAFQVVIKDITERKRLEKATRINEEKYKRLFHTSAIGIFHSTLNGKLIDINNSFAQILGYTSREEAIELITDIPLQLYANIDDRIEIIEKFKNNSGWVFKEVCLKRKDGMSIICNLSVRKEENEEGEIEYFLGFAEDITEKKKAEEQLAYESALNEELTELTGHILNAKSLEEISDLTLEKAQKFTGSKYGFVGHIDLKTGHLLATTLTHDIWDQCDVSNKTYEFDKFTGLWGWVLIHKKSLLTNEPMKDYRSGGTPAGHVKIERFLAVPAMHDSRLVGEIALSNSYRDYNANDLVALERLASIFALGVRRVQAVNEVVETQEKFRLAFLYSNVGSVIVGLDKKIMRVNSVFTQMIGYDESELLGKSFDELSFPEDIQVGKDDYNKMLAGELDNTIISKRYIHKEGRIIWAYVSSTLLRNTKNEPSYFITHIQDFTEKIEADLKIKSSLTEKEVLLKELYHRTKNNMQVICAMLGLKALSTQDANIIALFKEMENRIQTMALVHQKLYQSKNLSKVDLSEYISDLSNLLYMSYNISSDKVMLELELEDITVLIDTAIPCGLLINELVSNSFKYAFPNDMTGKITISLKHMADDKIELKVADNGIGMEETPDIEKGDTLGFKLLYSIAEGQLQGDVKYETSNGVSYSIVFQDTLYTERV